MGLVLSPDHAVYVNEALIPVRFLINGCMITEVEVGQVEVDQVTYHHIELPRHDVVLAQGLPAESFLDMKDGSDYAKPSGPVRLYPDFTSRMWEAFGCAPLIVTGPELAAARGLVERFAGCKTQPDPLAGRARRARRGELPGGVLAGAGGWGSSCGAWRHRCAGLPP